MLTTALGYAMALPLGLGVPGLTISAGLAGWLEFALLRRALNRRIGRTGLPFGFTARLWAAALAAAAAGWGIRLLTGVAHPILTAAAVLIPYGLLYLALTAAFGLTEVRRLISNRVRGRG